MNYSETKARYTRYRNNMAMAEKDEMIGILMQTKPTNTKNTIHKDSKNEIPDKIMTPKRTLILFVRDYLKEFGRITARGLARKYENIFKNTKRKPDKQLIKDFTIILKDLVDLGILRENGSSRGVPAYTKIK